MRPELIAEFTTNPFGHYGLLERMARAAHAAGADFIKMQKKDVSTFYEPARLESQFKSPFGATYRDYRESLEFALDEWQKFDRLCGQLGIGWFATAQDPESLEFLLGFDLRRIKVASINSRDLEFLGYVNERCDSDVEIVISVAGSSLDQIDAAVATFPHRRLIIQHCVAEYPCELAHLRLGNIEALVTHFSDNDRVRVGYSGHEVGIEPSVWAAHMGAQTIERHFTMSRDGFIHHLECALTPAEFAEMRSRIHADDRRSLPSTAFQMDFSMSAAEAAFLNHHQYGGGK